jgi:HK97 family phage major capsid protein
MVDVMMADAAPDAVAVNPRDWAAMLKATDDQGGRLDSGGAFATPAASLWGLPAVPSKALTEGQALVGAFGTGATLFIREAVNVRISDSDQDDFLRNRITALAEGRFGVAVWLPASFVIVHMGA